MALRGDARVRSGLIRLAWRYLVPHTKSLLERCYQVRTKIKGVRKTFLIVALACTPPPRLRAKLPVCCDRVMNHLGTAPAMKNARMHYGRIDTNAASMVAQRHRTADSLVQADE